MKSHCFSIIIPTYNSSANINSCINSILKQTFADFEILIIDGLSADNTVEIVNSYNDSRIKIYAEPDKGIYDAMNKGISLSKGSWLYFMGSDDTLFNEDVLDKVYHYLKNSNAKLVYGNVLINGNCGWANDKEIYGGEFNINRLLKTNIPHQAAFYRKGIFDELGNYNLAYKVCADYDFNLRIRGLYKFQYVDTIVANFNAGGISSFSSDTKFSSDFNGIVFNYFKRKLFASFMAPYFYLMLQYGKNKFKAGLYYESVYYLAAGYYHGIKMKIVNFNYGS